MSGTPTDPMAPTHIQAAPSPCLQVSNNTCFRTRNLELNKRLNNEWFTHSSKYICLVLIDPNSKSLSFHYKTHIHHIKIKKGESKMYLSFIHWRARNECESNISDQMWDKCGHNHMMVLSPLGTYQCLSSDTW